MPSNYFLVHTSKCCEKSCHFSVCIQTIFTSKLMQDTKILKMHLLLAKAGKVFFKYCFGYGATLCAHQRKYKNSLLLSFHECFVYEIVKCI